MAANMVGAGVGFQRIRRITGYLVGGMDRWNNAKLAEAHDRVKHSVPSQFGIPRN
jgi:anaerobic ribonucleoside-triphosphate reductase